MNDRVPELHDDPALADLLRAAGRRAGPSADVEAEVRAAVTAEWRQVVAARAATTRRRTQSRFAGALALVATLAGVAVLLLREPVVDPGDGTILVATLTRRVGPLEIDLAAGQPLSPDGTGQMAAGSRLVTGPGGRAALALAGGGSLRVDADSRVAFVAADRVVLEQGAVYFDSGADGGPSAPFLVETRQGTFQHVGTQFQVRAAPGAGPVAVSVREGRVSVARGSELREAPAGERLTLLADGSAVTSAVAPDADEWRWIAAVTPPFSLEGRSLGDFLAWAARETGHRLEFASTADRAAAAGIRLSGSVEGLAPEQALAAVVATTRFDYRFNGGRLEVAHRPAVP
jgi:ferric-dicitrate binding protein FerR (iron transport regulator)